MSDTSSVDGLTQLRHIADTLTNGGTQPKVPVRKLLEWFGQQRRGWRVISTIQGALRRTGLQTDPDFASAYIDGSLSFSLIDTPTPSSSNSKVPHAKESTTIDDDTVDSTLTTTVIEDPVLRVRMLPAANRRPVTVTRDDPVEKALHLMLMHDYSQLPVTQNLRNVDGMISWRSISVSRMRGGECTSVRECLEKHEEVRDDDSLLTAFRKIVHREAVLVRDETNLITGIVTTADLSIMFREQTEPFLLLSEIENQLRRLINGRFRRTELEGAKDPKDDRRRIDSVTDLTFGECSRLLERPQYWKRLGVDLHRKTLITNLADVRDIRNDVMHFDPDGLSAGELQTLNDVRRLLRGLL